MTQDRQLDAMLDWRWIAAAVAAGVVAVAALHYTVGSPASGPDGIAPPQQQGSQGPVNPPMVVGEMRAASPVATIRNDGTLPNVVAVRPTGDPSACRVALTLGPVQLPHDYVAGERRVVVPVGGQAYVGVAVVPERAGQVSCWYTTG